jgi:oligopeptide/dipeptide ABC transporter ATP-binding protein
VPDLLLEVTGVRKVFPIRDASLLRMVRPRQFLTVLDGVDLSVRRGEITSLIGESGSGKSTLAYAILRLLTIDGGQICFAGDDVHGLRGPALARFRRQAQIIFQDTATALNPRKTVGRVIRDALGMSGVPRKHFEQRVARLLDLVGLPVAYQSRYPHEMSGGQRQRVGIARALSMEPQFLIADEPVAALDVSIQAQILNLLSHLRDNLGLTMLMVSHDLGVVSQISDRVAVMYAGQVVESGPVRDVLRKAAHPYTKALIEAVPQGLAGRGSRPSPSIQGDPEAQPLTQRGCRFAARCGFALKICHEVAPQRTRISGQHEVSCHVAERQLT